MHYITESPKTLIYHIFSGTHHSPNGQKNHPCRQPELFFFLGAFADIYYLHFVTALDCLCRNINTRCGERSEALEGVWRGKREAKMAVGSLDVTWKNAFFSSSLASNLRKVRVLSVRCSVSLYPDGSALGLFKTHFVFFVF